MNNIFKHKYTDQASLVNNHLIKTIGNFSEINHSKIDNLSREIIDSAINYKEISSFAKLIHEFSLTSNEGVVLMCLAEALLRIPDAATINDLIEDKIPIGDWNKHIKNENDVLDLLILCKYYQHFLIGVIHILTMKLNRVMQTFLFLMSYYLIKYGYLNH